MPVSQFRADEVRVVLLEPANAGSDVHGLQVFQVPFGPPNHWLFHKEARRGHSPDVRQMTVLALYDGIGCDLACSLLPSGLQFRWRVYDRSRWGGDKLPDGFIRLSIGREHPEDLNDRMAGRPPAITKRVSWTALWGWAQ